MMYRRPQFNNRHLQEIKPDQEEEVKKTVSVKETPKIPLPNETESVEDNLADARGHNSNFIKIFNHKIFLDEIILIGLLIILFAEGIEDELLLIVLLYLLLGDFFGENLKGIFKI